MENSFFLPINTLIFTKSFNIQFYHFKYNMKCIINDS